MRNAERNALGSVLKIHPSIKIHIWVLVFYSRLGSVDTSNYNHVVSEAGNTPPGQHFPCGGLSV